MKARTLLLATNNPHKVAELQRLLREQPYRIVTPADLGLALEVVEDGATYAENAAKKARAFAQAAGMLSLADDSGIEVDALDGRPGIYSARYGGQGESDKNRVQLLLLELHDVPRERRGCRYVALIALAWPDGRLESFEGVCEGMVAWKPEGANGFGYDPIFYSPAHGMTVAQMPPELKDRISHRSQATRLAAGVLRSLPSTTRP
jgi:XTP/dITP diphosphohydrolase